MNNVVEEICDSIIKLVDEMSTDNIMVISNLGYLQYLVLELSEIIEDDVNFDTNVGDEIWRTLKNGAHIQLSPDTGEVEKGPKALVGKDLKEESDKSKDNGNEKYTGFESKFKKTSYNRDHKMVTHFYRNKNKMVVAKDVMIKDTNPKKEVKLLRGELTGIDDFAGKKSNGGKPVEKAIHLTDQYGGNVNGWTHSKGYNGKVLTKDGKVVNAEIHWFENDEVGQVGMKVKYYM